MRIVLFLAALLAACPAASEEPLRLGVFDVDASPPVGSPLAYDPTAEVLIPLSCRGVVLLGSGQAIVLCAVDWLGIGNGGHREFCEVLAKAAGTSPERVAVHALHQHDAPWCDFTVDELLARYEVSRRPFDSSFGRQVIARCAEAVARAASQAAPLTHLGLGKARVEQVASNRRILGPDGKVLHMRFTATADPAVRAFPEGTVDPWLRLVCFYHGEQPLAALTYYATHPQSYYRTGKANPDFPGIARNQRQEATGVPHVHFNGAGGNVGAGKYNDGSPENRQVLADRLADGMARAWENIRKTPLRAADVAWRHEAVQLPPAEQLDEQALAATLADAARSPQERFVAANKLVWLRRATTGDRITLGCLALGGARILHLPGELFVEYQLAAQQLRPDLWVAVAAYGDYAPWYIGTAVSYGQGGYETGADASLVSPAVEGVLLPAIARLLEADPQSLGPLP